MRRLAERPASVGFVIKEPVQPASRSLHPPSPPGFYPAHSTYPTYHGGTHLARLTYRRISGQGGPAFTHGDVRRSCRGQAHLAELNRAGYPSAADLFPLPKSFRKLKGRRRV